LRLRSHNHTTMDVETEQKVSAAVEQMRVAITAARAELRPGMQGYQIPSYGVDIEIEYEPFIPVVLDNAHGLWALIRRELDTRMGEVVKPPWKSHVSSTVIEHPHRVRYSVRARQMERHEFVLPRGEIPRDLEPERGVAGYRWEQFSRGRGDRQGYPNAGVAGAGVVAKLDATKDVSTEETANQCDLCNDRARAVICLPCGHYMTCRTCIIAVSKTSPAAQFPCPHCRTPVANMSEVFA
jgi:hypothetical protein